MRAVRREPRLARVKTQKSEPKKATRIQRYKSGNTRAENALKKEAFEKKLLKKECVSEPSETAFSFCPFYRSMDATFLNSVVPAVVRGKPALVT
jgi:hypothetical protein